MDKLSQILPKATTKIKVAYGRIGLQLCQNGLIQWVCEQCEIEEAVVSNARIWVCSKTPCTLERLVRLDPNSTKHLNAKKGMKRDYRGHEIQGANNI